MSCYRVFGELYCVVRCCNGYFGSVHCGVIECYAAKSEAVSF